MSSLCLSGKFCSVPWKAHIVQATNKVDLKHHLVNLISHMFLTKSSSEQENHNIHNIIHIWVIDLWICYKIRLWYNKHNKIPKNKKVYDTAKFDRGTWWYASKDRHISANFSFSILIPASKGRCTNIWKLESLHDCRWPITLSLE